MKISELKKKIAEKQKEEPVKNATITFTDPDGNKRTLTANRSVIDPYWDSRVDKPSPFRASLRHHAEKQGRRITPQAQAVEAEGPKTSGQLADFFEAIDEAAERFSSAIPCAYCGASGTDKNGACYWCSGVLSQGKMTAVNVVHTAGSKLNLEGPPHKIFVVDDVGVTRAHYIQQRTDGRTLINIDGQEVEV